MPEREVCCKTMQSHRSSPPPHSIRKLVSNFIRRQRAHSRTFTHTHTTRTLQRTHALVARVQFGKLISTMLPRELGVNNATASAAAAPVERDTTSTNRRQRVDSNEKSRCARTLHSGTNAQNSHLFVHAAHQQVTRSIDDIVVDAACSRAPR